jgi:gliding motility-associated-like protein
MRNTIKNTIVMTMLMLPLAVAGQLTSNFGVNIQSGCSPLSVNFTDSSSGGAVKWNWDFGNGNQSLLQNPSAIYVQPGTYSIRLITEDSTGKKDTLERSAYIEVFKNPEADFNNQSEELCEGTEVTMSDNSKKGTGNITSYTWDMGDGTVKTGLSPKHTYKQSGLYDITLIVKDEHGCESVKKRNSLYKVNPTPKADFTSDKTMDCSVPFTVKFTDKSTSSAGSTYKWHFGDGDSSTQRHPEHTYKNKGTYSVSLKVTNDKGCSSTLEKPNMITNRDLKANFNTANRSVCINQSVTFQSQLQGGGSDVKYLWDFGNGKTSTQANGSTTYGASGSYKVTLIVYVQGTACRDTIVKNNFITIYPVPDIYPVLSDTLFCDFPKQVFFSPSQSVQSAFWKFSSSPYDTSSKINTSFYYEKPGKYDVNYTFTDKNGCVVSGNQKGRVVVESPVADIKGQLTGCITHTETFSAVSKSKFPIVSYKWYLDGVLVSTDSAYTHKFDKEGEGELHLVMENSEGCISEKVAKYAYGSKTNPDFEPTTLEICYQKIAGFKNLTDTSSAKVTGVQWIIEGKKTSSWEGKHKFENMGKQSVTLITYNYGCPDSITKELVAEDGESLILGPKVELGVSYDTCGRTLTIKNNSEAYTSFLWTINGKQDSTSKEITIALEDSAQEFNIKLWATNSENACPDDSVLKVQKTVSLLHAAFSHNDQVCSPAAVKFNNESNHNTPAATDRYYWFINGQRVQSAGDGSNEVVSSQVNIDYIKGHPQDFHPVFNFGNAGDYEVMMVAQRYGCPDTLRTMIDIKGPRVQVSATPLNNCLPQRVLLKNHQYIPGRTGYWSMGNGDTLAGNAPEIEYTYYNVPEDGKYKIVYLEYDEEGCLGWKAIEFEVKGPSISIENSPKNYCDKSVINFNAKIHNVQENMSYEYAWDFGDSTSSTSRAVEHTYREEGEYTVTLKVKDQNGCESLTETQVSFAPGNLLARIIADTLGSYCPPLMVTFFSESESKHGVPISKYEWKFGDGTGSAVANPQKTYTIPGKYTVTLKITDAMGCTDEQILPDFIIVEGPIGTYSFDPNVGCVPLTVNFSSTTNDSSNIMLWDLGDGNLSGNKHLTHLYDYPGTFTPLMILEDTFGCRYTLDPIDQIRVHPRPDAGFTVENLCFGDTATFTSHSSISEGKITQFNWTFGEKNANSSLEHPSYVYQTSGLKQVKLTATSAEGCETKVAKPVKIYGIQANVEALPKQVCVGNQITIRNRSKSDTTIVHYEWTLSNGEKEHNRDLKYYPQEKGWYGIHLYLRDAMGCDTVVNFEDVVLVGDTVPSKAPHLLHVSVIDDYSLQIKHLSSREVDFESYLLYRQEKDGSHKLISESKDLKDTLKIQGGLNTLHNVYCYTIVEKNICGVSEDPNKALTHCTVEVGGEPDTNVSRLTWNAYQGWAVNKYVIYRDRMDGTGIFEPLAEVPGDVLTYDDSSVLCYKDHFYRILAYEEGGFSEKSWSDTCRVRPIYKNTVPPPDMRVASVPDNQNAELQWLIPENSKNKIHSYIIERSENGSNYRKLDTLSSAEEFLYFFDNNNLNVQEHNYFYQVKAVDACGDESALSPIAKTVLLKSYFNDNYKPVLYWTKYQVWREGVSHYIIEQLMPDGEFMTIGQSKGPSDTVFVHENVSSNCLPEYIYRVKAVRNQSLRNPVDYVESISNHTQVEVTSTLFAPTAFTPNGDGINDEFETKGIYIKEFNMKIFNRWGEKLFDSDDCFATWDGTFKGNMVPEGVYVYIVEGIGADGVRHILKSDLTLLR